MISEFSLKTSPRHEYTQEDLNIFEVSACKRYGSVESTYSTNTNQSVENLSLVPISYHNNNAWTGAKLTCAICGDLAKGVHYNVVSCHGCKTFFRRTVVTGRKFVCKNNGNCLSITEKTRCACRACRWQRCVEVGMNPNAIQYTPSANMTLSIARKRFQRSLRNPSARSNIHSLQSEQEFILQYINRVLHLDEKSYRLRSSTFFNYDPDIKLCDLLNSPSSLGDADKYPIVKKWPKRPPELEFIDDLKKIQPYGLKFWFYLDVYLSIEYIKTFSVFQKLSTQDKCSLILDTCLKDLYMSSSYYSYTKRVDNAILYPDNTTAFFHRKSGLFELEKVLRRGAVPEMCLLQPDQIQFSLLRAICALNYTCNELSEEGRELINKECSQYTNALLKYLHNKHGIESGTRRFSESIAFISVICQRIQNNYNYYAFKRCVLNIPPASVLFREIMTKKVFDQNV